LCISRACKYLNWSGTYYQDWAALSKCCERLGVKYTINRLKTATGDRSIFALYQTESIAKMGEFMNLDTFGLPRKTAKFADFQSRFAPSLTNTGNPYSPP
jgi:hypothetical protein